MKDKLKAAGLWALARSQEKSTWTGVITVIAAVAGHQLGNGVVEAISFAGPFVGGLLIAAETKSAA